MNGSRSEGKKQINHTLKLILRAFNGECDAAIAKANSLTPGIKDSITFSAPVQTIAVDQSTMVVTEPVTIADWYCSVHEPQPVIVVVRP